MKYSIVIPTYNHCDDLLKPCIESIFKYTNMRDVELVISANGCTDNTKEYLEKLYDKFKEIGFEENLKIVWNDEPLGYAKATNAGIRVSSGKKIILLNNDTVLLGQPRNLWLEMLEKPFADDPKCGISGPIKQHSPQANHDFIVFFCAMIDRQVFDAVGLLNEEYGVGSGEDTEFCIEAWFKGFTLVGCCDIYPISPTMYTGSFPIYHSGEGTMHDPDLVSGWKDIYYNNGLLLAKKYNPSYLEKIKILND